MWGRVVITIRVDEVARLEMRDGHGDGEIFVGGYGVPVLGVDEFGGRHVGCGCDHAHGSWVAGTRLDLEAVGDGFVDGEAEIDEVVFGGERGA